METQLRFELPQPSLVRLAIYDTVGREIRLVLFSHLPAGEHLARWDGRDNAGQIAAAKVYFYCIDSHFCHIVRKLIPSYS